MKKTLIVTMVAILLSNHLVAFAQTAPEKTHPSAPSETTVFFADPNEAKKITESADTTYMSEVETAFSQEKAQTTLDDLDKGVSELRGQIFKLDRKYGTDDKQYLETRSEVVSIINDIEKTKDVLAAAIKKIYFYQRNVVNSVDKVTQIRQTLDETN